MFLVGLTGGIATGKSTVSSRLRALGCPVVDADQIARQVVEPGTRGHRKIKAQFGSDVFLADGSLDREKMGQIVFTDETKRKQLNAITHSEIQWLMMWQIVKYLFTGHRYVILDVPLLFETRKLLPFMKFVIVVACDRKEQLQRLMQRNSLSSEDAKNRIVTQMCMQAKCDKATHVIDNNGSMDATIHQVAAIHKTLEASWAHWKLRSLVTAAFISLFVTFRFLCN